MKFSIILFLLFILNIFNLNSQNGYYPDVIESNYIFSEALFQACHASTLTEIGNVTITAAWFGGKQEGNEDVEIWGAIKTGRKWGKPFVLANGIKNDSLC